MQSSVTYGYYDLTINTLKFLLNNGKNVTPVVPSEIDFEEMLKECTALSKIQLSAEDERKAFHEP